MNKKYLLLMPLVFGLLATSCADGPKTVKVDKEKFLNKLNETQQAAESSDEGGGVEISVKGKVNVAVDLPKTVVAFNGETTETLVVMNNVSHQSTEAKVIEASEIGGVKTSANIAFKQDLFTRYDATNTKFDVALILDLTEGEEKTTFKYFASFTQDENVEEYADKLKEVGRSLATYTSEAADELKELVAKYVTDVGTDLKYGEDGAQAKFEIVDETDAKVFTIDTNISYMFEESKIANVQANLNTNFTGFATSIEASLDAKKNMKEIEFPDTTAEGWKEVPVQEYFNKIRDSIFEYEYIKTRP